MSDMSSGRELKVEDVVVFTDPPRRAGLGEGDMAQLQVPAEDDLRRGAVVFGGEGQEDRILEDLAAAQRAPRLGADAQELVLFAQFVLLQPRMQLNLVDGGHHFRCFQEPVQVLRLEVADANGPDFALAVQRLKRPVGFREEATPGARPMDQVQVDVFQAEVGHRGVEGPHRGVVAVVVIPDLRGDEEVLPGDVRGCFPGPPPVPSNPDRAPSPLPTPVSLPYMAAVSKWR